MKKFRNLSLVLAGFALGVTVAYSPQIHAAATSLLGSKVGKVLDVKIDNKSIGNGAVINGTTYVPVRAAANAMGMEVAKVDSKEVSIVSTNDVQTSDQKAKAEQDRLKKEEDIANLKISIENQTKKINDTQAELDSQKKQAEELRVKAEADNSEVGLARTQYNIISKVVQETSDRLNEQKQQLNDLEAQLAELQK